MSEKTKQPPALKEYGIEADRHWVEVMDLAERYGFILGGGAEKMRRLLGVQNGRQMGAIRAE